MANDMMSDMYDQGTELDQEATVAEGADKAEKESYQSFLAPKSAFAGKDIEVGAVHRVKIDRVLDSELEMHCIEGESDENEPEMAEETNDDLY